MTARPEIKAVAKQLKIKEHQLKVEQGAHLPKVDAFVSYRCKIVNIRDFPVEKDNVTVGVAVEMNLFSGFNIKQRINAAERKLAEVRETERKTKLAVEREN